MKHLALLLVTLFALLVLTPFWALAQLVNPPELPADWIVEVNMTQLLGALAMLTGPWVVVLWDTLYGKVLGGSKLFGPFRAWIAAALITGLTKATGVPLPTDLLTNLNPESWMAVLMSGGVTATLATHMNNWSDGLKDRFAPETPLGKAVRAIGGQGK
jgi:hypothetical protein